MSNLTQVLPTNVIGWHDPPPDNLDLNALFTVEPLLPVADLQEIHGIAQEPPGAVNAGTRFQIAVQERALTHFPQLGAGTLHRPGERPRHAEPAAAQHLAHPLHAGPAAP